MELPDDVLPLVVSKLKYRDAVRTTVLSRRWIHFFPTLHDFKFDWVTMFLPGDQDEWIFRVKHQELCLQPWKDKFLTVVDQFLQFCQPSRMRSFEISFCLGCDQADHIDRLVHFAVQKGVQRLKLILYCGHPCSSRWMDVKGHYYVFRSTLLDGANTSLEDLHLCRCVLVSEPNLSHLFFQLRTLSLQHVTLDKCDLQSMLSCMAKLQYLALTRCVLCKELDLTSLSLLETLKFFCCWGLKKIELPKAKELLDFQCVNEKAVTFDLSGFCKLRNLHYSVDKKGLYNVYACLPAVPPTLRTVTVSIYTNINWATQLPRNITTFTGVTELSLEFRGRVEFCFSFLRFFPSVQRLSLLTHTFPYGDNDEQIGNFTTGTYAPEHLKEITIKACNPSRNTEFVTSLLNHAYTLEQLILIRRFGCCSNRWSWDEGERQRIFELLQAISKNVSMIVK